MNRRESWFANPNQLQEEEKMKNLFTLVLAGSLLLAGCAQKKALTEQAMKEPAPPVAAQEAPVVADQPVMAEPSVNTPAPPAEEPLKPAADRIFFKFDSYLLTDESRKELVGNALWLQAQPDVRVVIEGFADERGSDEYNLALGDKRARAARDYLVSFGIAPERISTISYGEEKATKGADSEEVWSQDRRAEFVIAN
jgi:peptidoglycan-associated lipoprotein